MDYYELDRRQGLVVQSIFSLTSSLRGQLVKSFTTLLPNTLILSLKKLDKPLHCRSFSLFFNKTYWRILNINVSNFNETLTNVVVSFEQLNPSYLNRPCLSSTELPDVFLF